jgi:hypothetical protein
MKRKTHLGPVLDRRIKLEFTAPGSLRTVRQSLFGRLAGYEDVNDAERLAHDPALRAIVGREGLVRLRCVQQPDGALRDRVVGDGRPTWRP